VEIQMSNLRDFIGGGNRPPKTIINGFNVATAALIPMALSGTPGKPLKLVLSGSMIAATLKTALSLTGSGVINWLSLMGNDATTRTFRMKITIDGVVVFDPGVSASGGTSGILPIGLYSEGSTSFPSIGFQPTNFNSSLLVEIASSLTETDKMTFGYNYITT
jgi:hypothetical protein